MRRDLCYYYEMSFPQVYNAYVLAAGTKFGKDCSRDGEYCISIGLNFSFKYNINGGSCTIRFMPCGNGTAVNLRYSIVQAAGARYGAHARDLNEAVAGMIGVKPVEAGIDVEEFVKYARMNTGKSVPMERQNSPASENVKFCPNCGKQCIREANFCAYCGTAFVQSEKCARCGREFKEGECFCPDCGTKRE